MFGQAALRMRRALPQGVNDAFYATEKTQ